MLEQNLLEQRLIEAFARLGFDEYKKISTKDIIFSRDVIEQCARNTCGNYGKNHSCPPLAGSEEERRARVTAYQKAFLLSKIVSIASREEMKKSMAEVARITRELRREFENDNVLVLGAGPCRVCEKCAALENRPCRFPHKIQYSMEGSGIDVVRLSQEQGMTYNAGGSRVGFFILVLF